jgi:hypothetical protein
VRSAGRGGPRNAKGKGRRAWELGGWWQRETSAPLQSPGGLSTERLPSRSVALGVAQLMLAQRLAGATIAAGSGGIIPPRRGRRAAYLSVVCCRGAGGVVRCDCASCLREARWMGNWGE